MNRVLPSNCCGFVCRVFRSFWTCLRISLGVNAGKYSTQTQLVLHRFHTTLRLCSFPRHKTESEWTCAFCCFRPLDDLIMTQSRSHPQRVMTYHSRKFRISNEFSSISHKVISNNVLISSKFVFLHAIKFCHVPIQDELLISSLSKEIVFRSIRWSSSQTSHHFSVRFNLSRGFVKTFSTYP